MFSRVFNKLRRARADMATMQSLFPAAEQIALRDGLERPGAEHLLLAAFELHDTTARDALGQFGVSPSDLHRVIIDQHAEMLQTIGVIADENAIDASLPPVHQPQGVYRSEGSMQRAFQRSVALAKQDRSPLLSGHVLLAATEPEVGTVARAFTHLALDTALLAEATKSRLDHPSRR